MEGGVSVGQSGGADAPVRCIRAANPNIPAWCRSWPKEPLRRGALSGVPFGVKDVIETKGLATEYGSPVSKGRVGTSDAAIVRELGVRGAILLGKTHTAAFADPDRDDEARLLRTAVAVERSLGLLMNRLAALVDRHGVGDSEGASDPRVNLRGMTLSRATTLPTVARRR